MSEAPPEQREGFDPASGGPPGRLHASSLLFRVIPIIRSAIVPVLAVLFATSGSDWTPPWEYLIPIVVVGGTLYEFVQYLTYRYGLRDDELLVTSGAIFKRARHIDVDRIQSVDMKQGPLHRALRVAEVRIETAGGKEPEAVLRVLGVADVERLRERLRLAQGRRSSGGSSEGLAGAEHAPANEREILTLSIAELTKLGLVSMRGAAITAVLVGLAWELGLFDRLDVRGRLETIADVSPTWQIAFAAAVVMLSVALLLVIVSIGWTIVRLYAFRLVEVEGSLRLSCGLLTHLTATVPRRRIQLLSVIQTPVHRYFDRVSVRIETASGSAETEQKKIIGQRWFVPILPTSRVGEILGELVPGVSIDRLEWNPLAPRALRRALKLELVYALAIGLLIMLFSRPAGFVAIPVLIGLLSVHAWLDIRRTAWAIFEGGIAYRRGVLTRSVTLTLFEKVQCVSVEESPFDRNKGMATLDVDTAGAGAAGRRIRIKYLERATADRLYHALSGRAADTELRW